MKIYIAEDEPLAAAKLKLFLEKLGEGGDISVWADGVSALAAIERERPDLLFLDIQMPGLTGMQILPRLHELPVIVTSAYDQYAIDSFSLNVTDYLLKPNTLERLKMAVEKGKKVIRLQQLERSSQARQITLRIDGKNEILRQEEIIYLEAVKDYVRVVMADGLNRLVLETLGSVEKLLANDLFLRIHRSFIVNRQKIAGVAAHSLTMADGTEIPIGRKYRETLRTKD
ncbi:MAG: response regulator transcription factor [Bacteroidales bacterium]|nr:response regulator transcription factor [Bacteroidales bacterium]